MGLHSNLTGNNLHISRANSGAGSPAGVQTPTIVGEFYWDTTNDRLYAATGLTNNDWVLAGSGGAGASGIIGPGSSTNNAIALWDGAGGDVLKDSSVSVTAPGSINIPSDQEYLINGSQHTHSTDDISSGTLVDARVAESNVIQHEGAINHANILNVGSNSHSQIDTHISSGSVHFSESSIDHANILNVGLNSHAYIDNHMGSGELHYLEGDINHGNIQNIGTNSHTMIDNHMGSGELHFFEASINHTAIQNIGVNSHATIDNHISSGELHYLESSIDHTNIQNIGTNSHTDIDDHISSGTIHFTEASIDHANIQNIGVNTHANIDTHIGDNTLHRVINDSSTSTTELWSSNKIDSEITLLSGSISFVSLTDTPSSYSTSNAIYKVNNAGNGVTETGVTIDDSNNLVVPGDFTVNGTTTTIDSTTLLVEDKNIEMGVVGTPTDITADGGGITLKGDTDKTITWDNANDNWTANQSWNIATGLDFKINNVSMLNATTLGSSVLNSSLTSVGTLGSLTVTNNINTTAGAFQLNGTDINTAGTLTNVAYENQTNTFTQNQSFGDNDITNVGNISLDSISSDGASISIGGTPNITLTDNTAINCTVGTDPGDDFTINTNGFIYEGDTGYIKINTNRIDGRINIEGSGNRAVGYFRDSDTQTLASATTLAAANQTSASLIITNSSATDTNSNGIFFLDGGGFTNGGVALENLDHDALGGGEMSFWVRAVNTASDTMQRAMTINTNGRVGIGEVSPDAELHVSSVRPTIKIDGDTQEVANIIIDQGILINLDNSDSGSANADFIINRGSANVNNNGVSDFIVNNNGKIGVGITAPPAKLSVKQSAANFGDGFRIIQNGTTDYWEQIITADKAFRLGYNGATKFYLNNDSSLGLGESPDEKLHISDALGPIIKLEDNSAITGVGEIYGALKFQGAENSGTFFAEAAAGIEGSHNPNALVTQRKGFLRLQTATGAGNLVDHMVIDDVGNVGIGTTNPSLGKLHIENTASVSAHVYANTNTASQYADYSLFVGSSNGVISKFRLERTGTTTGRVSITQPDGTGTTNALIIDESGNVGIATNPFAWQAGYTALNVNEHSITSEASGNCQQWFNSYDTGVKYAISTGYAGNWLYNAGDGSLVYRCDDTSRTGGTAATLNEVFEIDRNGKVSIGGQAPLTNMAKGDLLLEGGSLVLKEITTPTADTNYGKIYTKTDNNLYFQDGAGAEHQISFV